MPSLQHSELQHHLTSFNITVDGFPLFIETGTWCGETTTIAAPLFQKIYTIEVLKSAYSRACEMFKNTNVNCILGDSVDVFNTLLPTIKDNVVFWLDGHYSGPGTGLGKYEFPALQECELIDALLPKNIKALILIDDVRMFGSTSKDTTAGKDTTLQDITVQKILNQFKNKTIAKYNLFDSSISPNDRLGILIT